VQRNAPQPLAERCSATPQNVAVLRRAVVQFAKRSGASVEQSEGIALAVSEALTNAVRHAYAESDAAGVIVVNARVRDSSLEVVVADEGSGMREHSISPGLGAGMGLIARLTSRHELENAMPGLRVRMTFAIG
jgi:serine/threonine-protein kinase RsbW